MPAKIDIVTQDGSLTGHTSTITNALKKGLWHRGVHVIVYSRTGYVAVQKRSKKMRMHPNLLDISCGGFIDQGEEPPQAAVRELHEELGLRIQQSQLIPIRVQYKNHVWRRVGIHDRAIIHCYLVVIDDHLATLKIQPEEVEWAQFIPVREARILVKRHRIKRLGRLEPTYAFYKQLLSAIDTAAKQG